MVQRGTLACMIRAVLFDLYDTLLYLNAPLVAETRRQLAAPGRRGSGRLGHPLARQRGGPDAREARGPGGRAPDDAPAAGRRSHHRSWSAELAETETAGWASAVTLYPETVPTLAALRERGLLLGLISNCSAQAGAVLERIGLAARFDALMLLLRRRPGQARSAIFDHAARALGVALTESMFVADGAFTELDAAKAAGMVAVKIEQAHQSGDYGTSTSFDHRVERLTEVLGLLDSSADSQATAAHPRSGKRRGQTGGRTYRCECCLVWPAAWGSLARC